LDSRFIGFKQGQKEMTGDDKILELEKGKAYLSAQLEEATKELVRLDLKNLILTQEKKQAFAAFNFIKIIQEKIESAFTLDDLYLNVVKAITDDLCMDSAAFLKINRITRDISISSSSGLPKNNELLKLDRSIPDQEVFKPTFVNSNSSLLTFHRFIINSFMHPFFIWYPIRDENDGTVVLFAGNKFEDLMSKQPFSETSLAAFGAISSVVLLRKDNIAKTVEMIRRKEERIDFLAEILKASPIAVIATDCDARITYINPAVEKLYGYKSEELIGKDLGILNAELNASEIQENIMDAVKQGKVWKGEVLNKKKDGELFYMHASIYPVQDKDGNFEAFVGFQEDITGRKKVERALQKSEKEYRELVDNALVGVCKTNSKGDLLYVNDALWKMLEFRSSEEMMVDGILSRYKDPERGKVLIERLGKEHRVENFEIIFVTKTGKPKHVVISASLDDDIISGMIIDISERKQAEDALRLYREIFYHSADAIAIINPQGFYLEQNPAHRKLLGYSDEDIKGKTPAIHLGDETFAKIVEEQIKKGVYRGEVISSTKIGEKKNIDLSAFAIKNRNNEVICYAGIKRDITERKRIRLQLQNFSRRLMEIQEADRRFLAGELHDQIGQNLTALGINLNILRSQFPEGMDEKMIERLEDSLKLVGEAIERVRNVMSGLRPPVIDDYGLMAALRWHAERYSKRTGIAAFIQEEGYSSRLPLDVETALFRIVQEVLTNVAKHAQAGQVDIILEKVDGLVQLTVSDDGVGFDPVASRQYKKEPGWGLITIEERAKAIGGKVYVKSSHAEGTQIIVKLPC
jgi:PAS domain S-box-containing protein